MLHANSVNEKGCTLHWSGELRDSFVMPKISISVLFAAPLGPNIAKTRTVTLEGGTQQPESHYSDEEPSS